MPDSLADADGAGAVDVAAGSEGCCCEVVDAAGSDACEVDGSDVSQLAGGSCVVDSAGSEGAVVDVVGSVVSTGSDVAGSDVAGVLVAG